MQPRVKNNDQPRTAADLFLRDEKDGSIRQAGGRRLVAMSESLLGYLHASTANKFNDGAQDLLYRTGYETALQEMLALNQAMRKEFTGANQDFWHLDLKLRLETWWLPHRAAGWGALNLDLTNVARGLALVELRGSAIAASVTGATLPVCHFYAGLFAGAFSFCERSERHAVEVECSAMHEEVCRFIIGPGAEVDSAEAWRKQGVAPAEIIRRLT